MAKEGGDATNILLLLGGAAAAYYVLNNYGPNGAVYNASGQAVNPSYWQSWFGGTALAAATAAAPVTPQAPVSPAPPASYGEPAPPSTTGPNPPVMQVQPQPQQPAINIYNAMQSFASTNAFIKQTNGQADAYQWATLWNEIGGLPTVNVGSVFSQAQLTQNPSAIASAGGAGYGSPAPTPGYSTQGLPLMSLAQFLSTVQSSGTVTLPSGFTWGSGMQGIGDVINLPSFNGGKRGFGGGFGGGFGKPN